MPIGDVAMGATLVGQKCSVCHTDNKDGTFSAGNGPAFDVNAFTYPENPKFAGYTDDDATELAAFIRDNMSAFGCPQSCANDIAAYLWSFRAGGSDPSSGGGSSSGGNIVWEEGFEAGSNGEAPAGWGTILGYGAVNGSNSANQNSYALLDSSRAKSGMNSVHVKTSNGMAPHFIFKEIPTDGTDLFVRAWVNVDASLGGGVEGGAGDHAHFMGTFVDPTAGDNQNELRFGPVKKGYIGGFMPKPGDAFTKDTPSATISASTWTCVEWQLSKNATFDKMYGWVDDVQVLSAESAADWQNSAASSFYGAAFAKYISFGWRAFGSVANVTDIWFDDIAVSTERIGCN